MFDHIKSFDPQILEDQLLGLLQRSPETQNLVSMRASQIIQQLLSSPIINSLSQQIKDLQYQLDNQKRAQQINHASSSKQSTVLMRSLTNQKKQMKQLHEKLAEKSAQVVRLNVMAQAHENLKIASDNLQKDKHKLAEKIDKLEIVYDKAKQSVQKYRVEVHTLNEKIDKLQQRNKILIHQLDKNKQTIRNLRISDSQLKKHSNNAQSKLINQQSLINSLQSKLTQQTSRRQNQRKQLNLKLKQSHNKYKFIKSALLKLKIKIVPYIGQLKQINKKLEMSCMQQIQSLHGKIKQDYTAIMDEIGEKMMRELKQLVIKIERVNVQAKIYRQQCRIKDQIIEKMERNMMDNNAGTVQLRKQLRESKGQVDKLKRELRRNYQESQGKLQALEYTYRGILYDTTTLL